MGTYLEDRRAASDERLHELTREAAPLADIVGDEPLCVYTTGSYGRGEAVVERDPTIGSDVDLFFLYNSDDTGKGFPKTTFYRLAGHLIELIERLDFPPFSGDAEYLEVHNVANIREELGSPTDDSVNTFTARMLLLLESRPLLGEATYDDLLTKVVEFYFTDFEAHKHDFRPTFLLNDILRFWRTLTLNYEHSRHKNRTKEEREEADADPDWVVKSAEKNLKLGFSRLNTCFSMVVPLAWQEPPITRDHVLELTRLPPLERWERIGHDGVSDLLELYEWFLRVTADKSRLRHDLAERGTNAVVGTRDKRFGDLVFQVLLDSPQRDTLRYVVV